MHRIKYSVGTLTVLSLLLSSCNRTESENRPGVAVKAPAFLSIALNSDRFLWLVTGEGREIVRTSDGGATWEHTPSPPDEQFWELSFVDPLNGWAVTDRSTIWRTTDGGASWVNIGRLLYDDGLSEHEVAQMYFRDDQSGWVVTALLVWRTEDGGYNWSASQPDLSDERGTVQLFRGCFIDAQTGWVTGTGGAFYATSDGGRSWTRNPRLCDGGLLDLFFLDELVGWMDCGTSGIFGTEDGGQDWFEAHLPDADITVPDEEILVRSLTFTSRLDGWAAGTVQKYDAESTFQSRAILMRTRDGGHNWEEVAVAGDERMYDSVEFGSPVSGWLFGSGGKVYRTVDGGQSWTPVLKVPVDER
jgi:photosystem II stability/assembly factor-like uncharacterized protein